MSDIKQAIQELREAAAGREWSREIDKAYSALEVAMLNKYGVNNPIDVFRNIGWWVSRVKIIDNQWKGFDTALALLESLESAVASPTPDLSARISAAAEEIAAEISAHEWYDEMLLDCHIAAIITRHIEGGK